MERIDTVTPPRAPDATMPTAAVRDWAAWIVGSLLGEDPFSYCGVLVHDAEAGGLRVVGHRSAEDSGADAPSADELVPLDGTVCGRVFRTASAMLVPDVRQPADLRPSHASGSRSELAVPVVRDGRAVAVITVESPRVGGLDISDLQHLSAVSAEAAEAVPSAALRRAEAPLC